MSDSSHASGAGDSRERGRRHGSDGVPGSTADRFGKRLGLRHAPAAAGHAVADGPTVTLTITEDHLNGAGIAHGGVLFSALDEAVAVVANRARPGAVLSTATVHCTRPALLGDTVEVRVTAVQTGRTLSVFEARAERDGKLVAHMVAQTV